VPAKITSSILPPRRDLAPCSPITQLSASTTLDLPDPLGPTTQVMPDSKLSVVAEANDLNPRKVKLFRYKLRPLDRDLTRRCTCGKGDINLMAGASFVARTRRATRRNYEVRVVRSECSGSSSAVAEPATECLPRTAENVHTLFSTKDRGVTIAMVISCAQ
jgi:hypothetical protein